MQTPLRLADLPPPPPDKFGWPWTEAPVPVFTSGERLPSISIITPSYQQSAFLEETIRSVLLQGYPSIEYIVIDGGSTDGSVEILQKYESWLRYWVSERDDGQSDAINKGLARATGEIINWLNSDDFYRPGALLAIGRAFAAGEPLAVCGRTYQFGAGRAPFVGAGTDVYPALAKTIGWARIDQPAAFFHARAVEKMGALNRNLHYCMVREWWINFLLWFGQKRVLKTDEIWVNFRLHPASKTVHAQSRFAYDRDSIFYSIARQIGQTEIADKLLRERELLPYYHFPFDAEAPNVSLLENALHYYLFLVGMEYYEQLQFKTALSFWELINASLLDTEDRHTLGVLRGRARRLPPTVVAAARAIFHRR